jgi:PKD repeat protein
MRSIRLMAATTVTLLVATACGDGGGVGPNNDPVADFNAAACIAGAACTFTDASSDPDGNNTITTRAWEFGDPASGDANRSSEVNPSHIFAAAGTYGVKLTVTDNGGKSNAKTIQVPVAPATPANVPPVASFAVPACVAGAACTFTSPSTDTDGQITLTRWDFGGGVTRDGVSVTHTFTTAGSFPVILTVTDNVGATHAVTQAVTVTAPAGVACPVDGTTLVNCGFDITARSTVTITLTSRDCELKPNQFRIREPLRARQLIFFNGCLQPAGTQYPIDDDSGTLIVFQPGERIETQFIQGNADPEDPPKGAAQATIEGTYPTWTIRIDDGGDPTGTGEPDFDDIVLTIRATAAQ